MKKYFKFLSLPLLAIIFNSCQPKDYKEIGQPISTLSSLQGTWKLAKVTQTERIRARHILVATEKEANDIEAKLQGGAKFED